MSLTRSWRVGSNQLPWCQYICLSIEYRSTNRHPNLWIRQCISSWWLLVWFRQCLDILKCLTDVGVGVWWWWWPALSGYRSSCAGCWLWFLHWPIPDARYAWYTVNISYRCVCNNTLSKGFPALGRSLRTSEWNRCYTTPLCYSCIWTRIFCRGISGFVTGCPSNIWGRGLTTSPCMLVHFFGKCNLTMLDCKLFISNFTVELTFMLTWVLCTSISHRRDPYSFKFVRELEGFRMLGSMWFGMLEPTAMPTK